MSSKPENKLLGNVSKEENDKHPGVCPYGQLCAWKNPSKLPKDEINGIYCGGCAYYGIAYNGEVIRCFHATRFLWCGFSRDKQLFAYATRQRKGGNPMISTVLPKHADGIRLYFKHVLNLKELPEPSTDADFDAIDRARKAMEV